MNGPFEDWLWNALNHDFLFSSWDPIRSLKRCGPRYVEEFSYTEWIQCCPMIKRVEPFRCLTELHSFLNLHHLDVIKVLSATPHYLSMRIYFAFLNDPWFCPRNNALREPPGHGAPFEDEPGGEQRTWRSLISRNDVAWDDMSCIGIRVAEEKRERDDRPGIAVIDI